MAGANWVHYVHAAYTPHVAGTAADRAKAWLAHRRDLAGERTALHEASIVVCNSQRTARDVIDRVGVPAARVAVVYYGTDPTRVGPVRPDERVWARARLGRVDDRPLVGFVGALGDRRKAFDTLFTAWARLCRRPDWDADLIVVGAGAELAAWRARAATAGMGDRIAFLGFRDDVPQVLAALNALVHPARYEAYGLSAHEAICRGVPTLVSASAGVAERYPEALTDLLIRNPDDEEELMDRLRRWRVESDRYRTLNRTFADRLRARTWNAMAEEIVTLVEQAA
jgi:glycosyltransferase involved in cell wall biosynthesis